MTRLCLLVAALTLAFIPARAQERPGENGEQHVAVDAHIELLRARTLAALEAKAAEIDGVVGLAARDLRTGEVLGLNADLVFPQGSAIKIPVLVEVARQAGEGRIDLDAPVVVRAGDLVGGSGVLQFFGDGTATLAMRDLATLMIVLSDNSATNLLIDRVGMEAVNRLLAGAGLSHTRLRRRMIDQAASARGDENTSTPAEAVAFLAKLRDGALLDEVLTQWVLGTLRHPKATYLGRRLPGDAALANKTGGITGVVTEWGLVSLPRGAYAVAVMANYAVGDNVEEVFADLSRIVYDYFMRRAVSTRYGTRVPAALLEEDGR